MSSAARRCVVGLARAVLATVVMTGSAFAAGGPPATKLINVVDTRGLESGPSLWVSQIYNDSFPLFGLLVVVVMATQGAILGFGFDRVMNLLGLDLGKLSHHE